MPATPTYDAIIIGAGAAGLRAAMALSDADQNIRILEARDRIGGRIHTIRPADSPLPIELGAEFIHGKPPETLALLRRFNLPYSDTAGERFSYHRGKLRTHFSGWDSFEEIIAGAATLRQDISFDDYLDRHKPGTPLQRAAARSFIRGFDAASTDRISSLALAAEKKAAGEEADALYRLPLGYDTLIDAMAGSLEPNRLTRGASVRAVTWKKEAVTVTFTHQQREQTISSRRLLVTVPVGVLQAGSIQFNPRLQSKQWAIDHLAMGAVVRVALAFAEPFWEHLQDGALENLGFMHSGQAPHPPAIPTWWTQLPFRAPLLIGWAAGPAGERLTQLSPPQRVNAALHSAAFLLNMPVTQLRKKLRASHIGEWQTDPFSRGAYSYVTVGGNGARQDLARPLERTLFFAGEATTATGETGTVEAALTSGVRAARQMLQR